MIYKNRNKIIIDELIENYIINIDVNEILQYNRYNITDNYSLDYEIVTPVIDPEAPTNEHEEAIDYDNTELVLILGLKEESLIGSSYIKENKLLIPKVNMSNLLIENDERELYGLLSYKDIRGSLSISEPLYLGTLYTQQELIDDIKPNIEEDVVEIENIFNEIHINTPNIEDKIKYQDYIDIIEVNVYKDQSTIVKIDSKQVRDLIGEIDIRSDFIINNYSVNLLSEDILEIIITPRNTESIKLILN